MNNGWIKLHRKSFENFLYQESRPLTRREAWEDILLLVNHSESEVLIGNKKIAVKPGQSVRSLQSWAKHFRWSKPKVKRFFDLLQNESMIELENLHKTTRLTVCKWDSYQSDRNADETQVKRQRNASETPPYPNKNEKNEKNERIQHIVDFYHQKCIGLSKVVSLTDKRKSAIKARIEEHGMEKVKEAIVKVSETPFLNGDNERGWKANIDFIMKPDSMAKILEDYYSQKEEKNERPTIPGL